MNVSTVDDLTRPAPARVGPRPGPGPVPVAVLGAGYIADYHLDVLRRMGSVEVVAACDPDAGRLEALCRRWGIPLGARSLEDLLRAARPAVAHVLVPPDRHEEVAAQCLEAGLHVLLEKPMAPAASACDRLIRRAEEKGLYLGVNHNAVHHPLYRRLRADLAARRLGRIEHVVSINNLPLAQLEAGQHDHWMFRDPENVLFEQGPHPLSQICGLLGPVLRATTVRSGPRSLRGGAPFFASWQAALACAEGTADLFLSFGRSFPEAILHVIGQDGSVRIDLLKDSYTLDRRTACVPPLDVALRLAGQAGQVARGGAAGLARYGLTTLRLAGRSDPYYLSMRDGIAAFYEDLRAGDVARRREAAEAGRRVIAGLELIAAADRPAPARAPTPARPPRAVGDRPGEVVVLGGTGFIGRRLLPALVGAGLPVRLLARRPALVADLAEQFDLSVAAGDVRDPDAVARAVAGARAVIHLVAGAPAGWPEFERLFIGGTRLVAEACLRAGVGQLLFASSITAYYLGDPGVVVTEETPLDHRPEQRGEYARAKIACERLLLELHRARGLPVTIFRPGVVVGAGGPVEHLGVGDWPAPTHCIAWGRRVDRPLPFVLADDVAAALAAAVGREGLAGASFNLVGDVRLSAREYVAALRQASGRDIRLHPRSVLAWRASELFKWAVKAVARKPDNIALSSRELSYRTLASAFDCAAAKERLGWRPVADREEFLERGIRRALSAGDQER